MELHASVQAQENKSDNFSFFKLYITNEKNEVLLVKWHGEWEIAGTRYNDTLSLSAFIEQMAADMGVTITDFKLAGLFTQKRQGNNSPVLLHYYKANYKVGSLKVPEDCTDIKWFSYEEALGVIPYPMMIEIMKQITLNSGKVVGGAIETFKDVDGKVKYRLLEKFYLLN
ncbi:MAG: NUDIX hydrolase [Chitinophagaceae bacterium]|nr:NUDIX hydrolase [Chitinophagaceae bacterium]